MLPTKKDASLMPFFRLLARSTGPTQRLNLQSIILPLCILIEFRSKWACQASMSGSGLEAGNVMTCHDSTALRHELTSAFRALDQDPRCQQNTLQSCGPSYLHVKQMWQPHLLWPQIGLWRSPVLPAILLSSCIFLAGTFPVS